MSLIEAVDREKNEKINVFSFEIQQREKQLGSNLDTTDYNVGGPGLPVKGDEE